MPDDLREYKLFIKYESDTDFIRHYMQARVKLHQLKQRGRIADAKLVALRKQLDEAALPIFERMPSFPGRDELFAPPMWAEKLLSLTLPPARLEEALGDFDEAFLFLSERHGERYARFW